MSTSAFPVMDTGLNGQIHSVDSGMTLRDWFAGQALSALVSPEDTEWCRHTAVTVAAYNIADAMMYRRAAPQQEDET